MDNKEFQKTVLESFTRLEEGQVELKQEIKFVRDDLNSKIEMIANAVKQLVEKIDTLVQRWLPKKNMKKGLGT
jgi:hypothetical protein